MSRPLSRGPQFDDAAEAEPAVDRARPTERIDLAQVEAQAGATEAIAMPPGDEGWGRARRAEDDGHAHANGLP